MSNMRKTLAATLMVVMLTGCASVDKVLFSLIPSVECSGKALEDPANANAKKKDVIEACVLRDLPNIIDAIEEAFEGEKDA